MLASFLTFLSSFLSVTVSLYFSWSHIRSWSSSFRISWVCYRASDTLGCVYHIEGTRPPGKVHLVRKAWACLSGRGGRDEKTDQAELSPTCNCGVVSSIEMLGLEERGCLDLPTLPLPSCGSPSGASSTGKGDFCKFQQRL